MMIRPLETPDRAGWERLYTGYATFYGVQQTAEMRDRVWSWIHDHQHEVEGLVAENDAGALVGLAHFRPFARPLAASIGGFLDDLYVEPDSRGTGIARALIEAVTEEGRRRHWTVLRWITAEDNDRARALYDTLADATHWKTYDIKL